MSWALSAFEGLRLSRRRLLVDAATVSCRATSRRAAAANAALAQTRHHSALTRSRAPSTKPFYVTTPIFYVNADPHIGHLHSDVVADVLARWQLLRRRGSSDSVLATGTDEHGLKMQKVAETLGEDPKALCDRISKRFKALADAANIKYTRFIRTTDEDHKVAVHHLWKRLHNRGLIYKGSHAGWYAVSDEAFYPEGQLREVTDSKTGEKYKVSAETGQRVEWAEEENYKFKLSEMAPQLLEWLNRSPAPVQPANYHAQIVAEVQAGLQDLSVSRASSRLHWGIRVPSDESQSVYVWVDALTNYLTVTGYPWQDAREHAWPADVHVVGKDILRFHAIYWPAMLLAAGLEPPRTVLSHAHWTKDKSKMSKSRGNVVDPFKALQAYGVDTLRFFLMRVGGNFATDSDYSHSTLLEFHRKYLQGQLGNLLSRVTAPKIVAKLLPSDAASADEHVVELTRPAQAVAPFARWSAALEALPGRFEGHMERFELSKALEEAFEVIGMANEIVQQLQPWSASASEGDVRAVIYYTTETLRIAGLLLQPFMPAKMDELLHALGAAGAGGEDLARLTALRESISVRYSKRKVQPLFPKLDLPEEP